MAETTFVQHWAREGLAYCEAGSGQTVVAIVGDSGPPTRVHELLAERRCVMVFAMTAAAGTPQQAARRIGEAVMARGIERFDLMDEGAGAAAAVWLALVLRGKHMIHRGTSSVLATRFSRAPMSWII